MFLSKFWAIAVEFFLDHQRILKKLVSNFFDYLYAFHSGKFHISVF